MQGDLFFKMEIIAFGTHLSHFHGYTLNQILDENLSVPFQIESLVLGDTTEAVSTAMALTAMKFSSFWATHQNRFDLVFCIGDRYEMHAAVMAAVPFGIKFAHFHGGETTLGTIDNVFRHSISLCSSLHFVSTETYADRLKNLLDNNRHIYVTGALSLDNISTLPLYSSEEFYLKWNIDLGKPTILATLHPETLAIEKNEEYATHLAQALNQLDFQIVITMPNSDAAGAVIRHVWLRDLAENKRVFFIENFGTKGYFTCVKYCAFLLGNTSSGIIEAASFSKYVINLGERQKGRARGDNVLDCDFDVQRIIALANKISKLPFPNGHNIYWNGGAVEKTVQTLKEYKL